MTWLHQCRTPGDLAIWLRRRKSGAGWRCRTCGSSWLLVRRHWEASGGGYSFWEWRENNPPTDETPDDSEPDRQGAESRVETAWQADGRDDGERFIPNVQLGFQREMR